MAGMWASGLWFLASRRRMYDGSVAIAEMYTSQPRRLGPVGLKQDTAKQSWRRVNRGAEGYFRMELSELCFRVDSFVRDKQWYGQDSAKPQTPKNLAISLAIEAAEVLEHFQWSDSADSGQLAGELADVLIYTAQLANVTKIDLEAAVRQKLAINQERTWLGDIE